MKSIIIAVLLHSIVSCQFPEDRKTLTFIPGVYVRHLDHQFASGADTLVILHDNGNTYTIQKRSGFRRFKAGQWLPMECRRETWMGTYHEKDRVMEERRKGKLLHFKPEQRLLLVVGTEYKKVD